MSEPLREPPAPDSAPDLIGAYLEEVGRRLPGGRADRRDVLDELSDHLLEAAGAGARGGLDGVDAARAAIATSGPPARLARAYAPELLLAQVRRSAWRVLLLLLAGGAAWQACRMLLPAQLNAVVPAAGWPRTVFLAGVDTIRTLPSLTQVGALALLVVLRVLARRGAAGRLLGWLVGGLAGAVSVTMVLTLAAGVAMAVTADARPPLVWLAFGTPTAVVLGWALAESARAAGASRTLAAAEATRPN